MKLPKQIDLSQGIGEGKMAWLKYPSFDLYWK